MSFDTYWSHLYTYKAKLVKVTDGDSLWLELDRGFRDYSQKLFRIDGIDAPELKTKGEEGENARDYLARLLDGVEAFIVKTKKDKQEKYGRYLADIWLPGKDKPISVLMVEAGHAKPYDGGQR